MKVSDIAAIPLLGSNGKAIRPGDRVRSFAMIERDGPRHSGRVVGVEYSREGPPVIVVLMDDGKTQRWGTKWTSKGPWDLKAPFRTDRGRVI